MAIRVGDAVKLTHQRLEAVVDTLDSSGRGARVEIDGPNEEHALFGASMWVARDDMKALPIPKVLPEGFALGAKARATLPTGECEDCVIVDIRQGLKKGPPGLRIKCQLESTKDCYWARMKDVEIAVPVPVAESDEVPSAPEIASSVGIADADTEEDEADGSEAISQLAAADQSTSEMREEGNAAVESTAEEMHEERNRVEEVMDDQECTGPAMIATCASPRRQEEEEDDDDEKELVDDDDDDHAPLTGGRAAIPRADLAGGYQNGEMGDEHGEHEENEGLEEDEEQEQITSERDDDEIMEAEEEVEKDEQEEKKEAANVGGIRADQTAATASEWNGETVVAVEVDGAGGDGNGSGDDDDGSSSSSGDALEENDAAVVKWGGREYNCVILELKPKRAKGVRVQFDATLQVAWVGMNSVRAMDEADEDVPAWATSGSSVQALDPVSGDGKTWHAATVEETRRGVNEGKDDDGVRLWVKYEASQLCQWLRIPHICKAGLTPPQPPPSAPTSPFKAKNSRARCLSGGAPATAAAKATDAEKATEDAGCSRRRSLGPSVRAAGSDGNPHGQRKSADQDKERKAAAPRLSSSSQQRRQPSTLSVDGTMATARATSKRTRIEEDTQVERERQKKSRLGHARSGKPSGVPIDGAGGDGNGSGDDDDGSSSSSGDALEENDAAVVKWGGREYNCVILELKPKRAKGVRVQFDATLQVAWVGMNSVRAMDEADEDVPAWATSGSSVQALDPVSGDGKTWHAATVEETRRGVNEGKDDDGVRLWVKYEASQLCQWLRILDVRRSSRSDPDPERPRALPGLADEEEADNQGRETSSANEPEVPGPSEAARPRHAAAKSRTQPSAFSSCAHVSSFSAVVTPSKLQVEGLSRSSGCVGDTVWLLLSGNASSTHAATASVACSFEVSFGATPAIDTHALAPNVLECTVPRGAPLGVTSVRLLVQSRSRRDVAPTPVSPACSMRFEILADGHS